MPLSKRSEDTLEQCGLIVDWSGANASLHTGTSTSMTTGTSMATTFYGYGNCGFWQTRLDFWRTTPWLAKIHSGHIEGNLETRNSSKTAHKW